MLLYTVGHGTADAVSFAALLRGADIRQILDVRTKPGSQRFPWFGRAELEQWLPASGIAYGWEPALGGFRSPRPDSPNVALRSRGFRGYADHMAGPDFAAGFRRILDALESPGEGALAVMCSESLWWKCHRRLIADAATLLHGLEVVHLAHDARVAAHRLTDAARRDPTGHLVYDTAADQLALGFTSEP